MIFFVLVKKDFLVMTKQAIDKPTKKKDQIG
jgi:hypothetical protein